MRLQLATESDPVFTPDSIDPKRSLSVTTFAKKSRARNTELVTTKTDLCKKYPIFCSGGQGFRTRIEDYCLIVNVATEEVLSQLQYFVDNMIEKVSITRYKGPNHPEAASGEDRLMIQTEDGENLAIWGPTVFVVCFPIIKEF
ncbi:hypothetical protein GEMRC1_003109 [Eukaryota sp. GEM-RC1]